MSSQPSLKQMRSTLAVLRDARDSIAWAERRKLPQLAAAVIEAKPSSTQVTIAAELLDALADDPKWEVRKAVADVLRAIPDEAYGRVLLRLSDDDNSFVRRAAETAIERRRKAPMPGARQRRTLHIGERLAEIERRFGPQASRMAREIGEWYYDLLVGATAHDARNILAPVPQKIERLIEQTENGSFSRGRARQTLVRVQESLGLLGRLIDDMREYALPLRADRRPERVAEILSEAIVLASEAVVEHGVAIDRIKFSVEAPPTMAIRVAREPFLMAIVNPVKNAIEAAATIADSEPIVELAAVSGIDEIVIRIRDTGPGIEASDLVDLRQFLPGRKTKKKDGTGFGLPIAHRIISAHDGLIDIESELGLGTTVSITVPGGQVDDSGGEP
jgi:signal transduction histidine kinase